jgi:hypothetical protein
VGGGLLHLINGVFLGNTSAYYTVPCHSTNAGASLMFGPVEPWYVITHDKTGGSIACRRHPPYRGLCAMDMASILIKSLAGIWDQSVLC